MAGEALRRRKEAHRARQTALKTRKRERSARGQAAAAIAEAIRMKASKKKGTADLVANMRALGWEQDPSTGRWRRVDS